VGILDSGKVDERALTTLGDNEMVVLHRDRSDNGFASTVEKGPDAASTIRAPVVGTVHAVPVGVTNNVAFNDRWRASVMPKPRIEDALPSTQVPDRAPNSTSFDLIAPIAGATVLLAFAMSGFRFPPVASWVRSVAGMSKRLWFTAIAKLVQLAKSARHIHKLARPAPGVLASPAVQRLSWAVRRRSDADRAALFRSRRLGPPKDESDDLPLAA
jgi:hypothetical protein